MEVSEELLEEALKALKYNDQFAVMDQICDSNNKQAIEVLQQALKPSKLNFYVGQPVLVESEFGDWQKHIILDKALCWGRKCIPDVDAISQPNWIEHDGSYRLLEIDSGNIFIACDETGWPFMQQVIVNANSAVELNEHVLRYCVIPLPKFME